MAFSGGVPDYILFGGDRPVRRYGPAAAASHGADRVHLLQTRRRAVAAIVQQRGAGRHGAAPALAAPTNPPHPGAAVVVDADSATRSVPQPDRPRARDP